MFDGVAPGDYSLLARMPIASESHEWLVPITVERGQNLERMWQGCRPVIDEPGGASWYRASSRGALTGAVSRNGPALGARLEPENPGCDPIDIPPESADEFRPIAGLVEVISDADSEPLS